MTKYQKAQEVLIRSREEVLGELARTGESGGTGLAQRYAPILVSLQQAVDVTQKLIDKETTKDNEKAEFAEKMRAAREAKKAAQ